MFLSECCSARDWRDDPQLSYGIWEGLCSKCGEHASFYDEDEAAKNQKREFTVDQLGIIKKWETEALNNS
jgi:hypothetical protein